MSSYSALGFGISLLLHAGMLAGGTVLSMSPSGPSLESVSVALPAVVSFESVSIEPSDELDEGSSLEESAAPEAGPAEAVVVEKPLPEVPPVLPERIAAVPTPVPAPKKHAKLTKNAVKTREVSVKGAPPSSSPQAVTSHPIGSASTGSGGIAGVTEVEAKPDAPRNAPPEYPYAARRARQEGTVLLLVDVDCDGTARNVELQRSCGHSLLDKAARDAVERWRFRPATAGGVAKPSRVVVPVRFVLNR